MTGRNEPSRLALRWMPHPADPARTVRIFDTWELACDHLQSHLLTEPECRAWALVIPEIRDLVELEEPESRWAYSQKAKQTEGGAAQKLYDAFSQSVRTAAGEAHRLKWFTSRPVSSWKTVTVALGTAGILMVVESWLKTAFLPGQGDPQAVREQQEHGGMRKDAAENARPGIRSGRSGRAGPKDHDKRADSPGKVPGPNRRSSITWYLNRPFSLSDHSIMTRWAAGVNITGEITVCSRMCCLA